MGELRRDRTGNVEPWGFKYVERSKDVRKGSKGHILESQVAGQGWQGKSQGDESEMLSSTYLAWPYLCAAS